MRRAGLRRLAAGCAVITLLSLPFDIAAAGTVPVVFRFSGRNCTEVSALIPVPEQRVRPFLPPGYEPRSAARIPGLGQVAAGVLSCEQFLVDGVPEGPASIGHAGLGAAPSEGATGADDYLLWHLSTSCRHRAGMTRAGIAGGFVPGMTATRSGPALIDAAAYVPWGVEGHQINVPTAAMNPAASAFIGFRWHQGPAGRAVVRITGVVREQSLGPGTLASVPASTLARLTGGTSTTAAATAQVLDFDAVVSAEAPLDVAGPCAAS